jgi:hypothetical protein
LLGIFGAGVGGLVHTSGEDDDNVDDSPTDLNASPSTQFTSSATRVANASSAETETAAQTPTEINDPNVPALPNRGPRPEFLPAQQWLQTDAASFDAFNGTVRAVQFWTFGCHHCEAT